MDLKEHDLHNAVSAIREADIVFILAGAGLSAEVGIPTYWSAEDNLYGGEKTEYGYTPLQHSDASMWMEDTYAQIAYFESKRKQFDAINFPSTIYGILLQKMKNRQYYCVTSNVDSGFHQTGFDESRLYEVHGSYRVSQCVMDATHGLFPVSSSNETHICSVCDMPTRPNALFFNDHDFNPERMLKQQNQFNEFVDRIENSTNKTVILELGVGDTIPRVRQIGNRLYRDLQADYIHVNIETEPEFLFGQACNFPNKEKWLQMKASDFIHAL